MMTLKLSSKHRDTPVLSWADGQRQNCAAPPHKCWESRCSNSSCESLVERPKTDELLLNKTCADVPSSVEDQELLLGGVVISKSLVRYDNGKQYNGAFEVRKGIEDSPGRPAKRVHNLIAMLEEEHWREQLKSQAAFFLGQLQTQTSSRQRESKYTYTGTTSDVLRLWGRGSLLGVMPLAEFTEQTQ